jgi:hypothetical protein
MDHNNPLGHKTIHVNFKSIFIDLVVDTTLQIISEIIFPWELLTCELKRDLR